MMRIPSAAAVLLACAASVLRAQDPAELALSPFCGRAGSRGLAASHLAVRGPRQRTEQAREGAGGGRARRAAAAAPSRRGSSATTASSSRLATAPSGRPCPSSSEEDTLSFRETGPMGVRTKSVTGPSVDFVVDASCPEMFIPFMMDRAREVRARPGAARSRDQDGRARGPRRARTLRGDSRGRRHGLPRSRQGGFRKLALPGPELRGDRASGRRVAAGAAEGPRDADGAQPSTADVRLACTLTLPAGGRRAVSRHPAPLATRARATATAAEADRRSRSWRAWRTSWPPRGSRPCAPTSAAWDRAPAPTRASRLSSDDAHRLIEVPALHPADRSGPRVRRRTRRGRGRRAASSPAAARDKIAGVIALAEPARPLAEALEARLRVRLLAAGQSQESIDGAVAALGPRSRPLRQLPDGAPVGRGQALLRDLARIDPAAQIAGVKAPLLVIHCGDDREVPASQVALMRASLAFSGAERLRFEMVEGAGPRSARDAEGRR